MNQVLRKGARKEEEPMMMESEIHDTAAPVAEAGAPLTPGKAAAKKAGGRKKAAPKGAKAAPRKKSSKPTKPGKKAARKNAPPRESKGATILEMIGRAKGATLAEIMTAVGWQAHSVRGFISTAGKKPGVRIESSKNDSGDRVYRIAK
jgi:hypothetical protein